MIKLNGTEIKPTIFNDRTSQVWQLPECCFEGKEYNIIWDFEHEGELFHLCQLVDLIKFGHVPKPIGLNMPYLPYGRQDKEVSNTTTFALKTFARIINGLHFDSVVSMDTHSNIAEKEINRFFNQYPIEEIDNAYNETHCNCMAFPDKGAADRYTHRPDVQKIIGHKVRDQLTGHITEYRIEGFPKGKDILIVDDICDGGMTFKLLAKELYEQGAKEVHLYVTHGIFSKGLPTLRASGIKKIYTKDGLVNDVVDEFNVNMDELDLLQRTELSNL